MCSVYSEPGVAPGDLDVREELVPRTHERAVANLAVGTHQADVPVVLQP